MKTKNDNSGIFENNRFDVLKTDELLQIKGGADDSANGTPTVKDGEFD
jgi:hypothetical protein